MGKIALELRLQWLGKRGLLGAAASTRTWTFASETYNLDYWERTLCWLHSNRATSTDSQSVPFNHRRFLRVRV